MVGGKADRGTGASSTLMDGASATLEPADTHKDDMAFWLYSSGTTGFPKGAIHLHHDMLVAADRYARETIGLGSRTSRSRWPSCSSPTGWATACISP